MQHCQASWHDTMRQRTASANVSSAGYSTTVVACSSVRIMVMSTSGTVLMAFACSRPLHPAMVLGCSISMTLAVAHEHYLTKWLVLTWANGLDT